MMMYGHIGTSAIDCCLLADLLPFCKLLLLLHAGAAPVIPNLKWSILKQCAGNKIKRATRFTQKMVIKMVTVLHDADTAVVLAECIRQVVSKPSWPGGTFSGD